MDDLNILTHRMLKKKRDNILMTFKKSILHFSALFLIKPFLLKSEDILDSYDLDFGLLHVHIVYNYLFFIYY